MLTIKLVSYDSDGDSISEGFQVSSYKVVPLIRKYNKNKVTLLVECVPEDGCTTSDEFFPYDEFFLYPDDPAPYKWNIAFVMNEFGKTIDTINPKAYERTATSRMRAIPPCACGIEVTNTHMKSLEKLDRIIALLENPPYRPKFPSGGGPY